MPYVCDLISWDGPNDKAQNPNGGLHELFGPFKTKTAATQFGREGVKLYNGFARYVVRELRNESRRVNEPTIIDDENPEPYMPKCVQCGKEIDADRVYAARSRGKDAKYCSSTCRQSANTKAYRTRKHLSIIK